MAEADPVARFLPWYANGTLSEEERRRVALHLPTCEACRELLGLARFVPEGGGPAGDHVQAQLLVEFCDGGAALGADVRRRIEAHLDACPACRGALAALEALPRASVEDAGSGVPALRGGRPARITAQVAAAGSAAWKRLAGSVLRPLPALAYFLALLILAPVSYQIGRRPQPPADEAGPGGGGEAPALVLAPPISLLEETPFRADPGEGESALVIEAPAGGGPVLMELVTDFDAEDLRDPDASFRLELREDGTLLLDEARSASDFDRNGVLHLQLDAGRLSPRGDYTWVIRLSKPGDARDGEVLYRRSFRVMPRE